MARCRLQSRCEGELRGHRATSLCGYGRPQLPAARRGAAASPQHARSPRATATAGRPIWITESGYPTGGKQAWTVVVSEAEQSRLERCEYQLLVGSKDIKVVLHNYLYDRKAPGNGDSLEDHWGLYRQDGTPKPIVADMAKMLSRPRHVSNCSDVPRG